MRLQSNIIGRNEGAVLPILFKIYEDSHIRFSHFANFIALKPQWEQVHLPIKKVAVIILVIDSEKIT